jgi:hypothetical protein
MADTWTLRRGNSLIGAAKILIATAIPGALSLARAMPEHGSGLISNLACPALCQDRRHRHLAAAKSSGAQKPSKISDPLRGIPIPQSASAWAITSCAARKPLILTYNL